MDQPHRWGIVVLAAIALFTALYQAQTVFAPLTLALVVGVVLSPVTRGIGRLGLPDVVGALLGLMLILALLGGLGLLIEPLIGVAMEQLPRVIDRLRQMLGALQQAMADLDSVSDAMAQALNPDAPGAAPEGAPATPPVPASEPMRLPRLSDALYLAPSVLGQVAVFVGTLFFFLLSRDEIYRWTARHWPRLNGCPTLAVLQRAEGQVSGYFLTILVINACFGLTVGGLLALIGMPFPMMWGLIAALLNFILYLGPALMAGLLLLAGALVFHGPMALAPVAVFVAVNIAEGQFVTPALVGRRMRVNPLLVFLSLVFWLWLWGPVGGFVAIPVLVWILAVSTPQMEDLAVPEPARAA